MAAVEENPDKGGRRMKKIMLATLVAFAMVCGVYAAEETKADAKTDAKADAKAVV
jgi:hypothetical protein